MMMTETVEREGKKDHTIHSASLLGSVLLKQGLEGLCGTQVTETRKKHSQLQSRWTEIGQRPIGGQKDHIFWSWAPPSVLGPSLCPRHLPHRFPSCVVL